MKNKATGVIERGNNEHHTIHPGEIFNLHPGKLDTKRSAIIPPPWPRVSSDVGKFIDPGETSVKRRFRACVSTRRDHRVV